jgi:hypothetical protein
MTVTHPPRDASRADRLRVRCECFRIVLITTDAEKATRRTSSSTNDLTLHCPKPRPEIAGSV